ncbi:hypothetical protein GCM10022206_60170 [Streptomyces chiangmaiensis]
MPPRLCFLSWQAQLALWIFLSWAVCTTVQRGLTTEGVQNLACYLLFISTTLTVWHRAEKADVIRFIKVLVVVGWLRVAMYGVDLLRLGFDAQGVYAARSFGVQAVVIAAAVIPFAAYVRGARFLPYALFLETVLSGSRTAMTAVGLLLVFVSLCNTRRVRRLKAVVRLGALAIVGWLGLTYIPAVHKRFFTGDLVMVHGMAVNSSGRDFLWSLVSQHASTSPWLGFGAGSATRIVRNAIRTSGEPHNDYLRLWHDFGYIGLGLWLLGYMGIMANCWRRARRSPEGGAAPHYAAALALGGVSLIMITGNVLIYFYAMLPLGVLVGFSLAEQASADVCTRLGPPTKEDTLSDRRHSCVGGLAVLNTRAISGP